MVDIISKKTDPRREDVVAKKLINNNWSTISRLADQISNGGYSKSRRANSQAVNSKNNEKSEPVGSNIHIMGGASKESKPDPVIQISINNRVIVLDARSGKQIKFLGQIRFKNQQKYFSLATKKNGFFATVDKKTEHSLADLNGVIIESDDIQEAFLVAIKNRLDL